MPKNTAKYASACKLAQQLWVSIADMHQEQAYNFLNERGYYWNPKTKEWELLDLEANPPTELIRIRVWSDTRFVDQIADSLISALSSKGMRCIERTSPYTCRPPNQLESRIYLAFQNEPENPNNPSSDAAVISPTIKKEGG
jgi:hypothetical protein